MGMAEYHISAFSGYPGGFEFLSVHLPTLFVHQCQEPVIQVEWMNPQKASQSF
jgi:hypothetical protein